LRGGDHRKKGENNRHLRRMQGGGGGEGKKLLPRSFLGELVGGGRGKKEHSQIFSNIRGDARRGGGETKDISSILFRDHCPRKRENGPALLSPKISFPFPSRDALRRS